MALIYWATRPPPPMKMPDAMSILIADFEDSTNDPVFKGTLENVLGTSMEGAAFITSYARQAALRIAQQIRPGRNLDAEAARLVAAREGIKVVLAGVHRVQRAGVPRDDQGPGSGNREAAGDGHGSRAIETGCHRRDHVRRRDVARPAG